MQSFNIKPALDDLIVRDPETLQPLAAEGEEKPQNSYWLRRLAQGDVIDIDAEAKAKEAAEAAAEASAEVAADQPTQTEEAATSKRASRKNRNTKDDA